MKNNLSVNVKWKEAEAIFNDLFSARPASKQAFYKLQEEMTFINDVPNKKSSY